MGRHSDAQTELSAAFESVMGRPPTLNERLFAGAIALGESGYSRAKYTNKLTGESKVLNNWGAIQCPSKVRPCPPGSFEVSDYDVLPDGSHKPFNQCYCDDATRALAAERFIRTLYKNRPKLLAAASEMPEDALEQLLSLTGTNRIENPAPLYDGQGTAVDLSDPYYTHIAWFSHVMRDSRYFGLELRLHVGAQIRYHNSIAAETGERIVPDSSGLPKDPGSELPLPGSPSYYLVLSTSPVDALGNTREGLFNSQVVRTLQTLLKAQGFYSGRVDGDHGPLTEAAIKRYMARQ